MRTTGKKSTAKKVLNTHVRESSAEEGFEAVNVKVLLSDCAKIRRIAKEKRRRQMAVLKETLCRGIMRLAGVKNVTMAIALFLFSAAAAGIDALFFGNGMMEEKYLLAYFPKGATFMRRCVENTDIYVLSARCVGSPAAINTEV